MKKFTLLPSVVIIISFLILTSCDTQKPKDSKAVIHGKYFPFKEQLFLNKVTANNVKIIDSTDISAGKSFMFKVNAQDYGIYRIAHKELYPLMVIVENRDSVEIIQTNDKAWPYQVKGSDECMLLVGYLERLNRDHYRIDSLAAVFHNSQGHPEFLAIREQLNSEFKRIHEEHKAYARQFVTANPSSLASIIVINGFFKEFPLFHSRDDFNYYEIIDEALMARMPENKHVVDYHEQVSNIRESNDYELEAKMRLSPGRLLPEFQLPSRSGTMVGPQDYKDRILLIYFWAAADAKSRQLNPTVKTAYEAYKTYGMEVMAISFDKDPKVWEAAIKLDELPGVHLSDLKGAGSPVQKLFNLKMQLPTYYLIDGKGCIFDHDTDFTKLQEAIIEIYSQTPDY
jgi:peroxiredoxin